MSEHVLPAEGPMRFISPIIQDNPTGWGPYEMPDQFRDMPYQPFSKGDRLGKISDWTMVQDKKYQSKSNFVIRRKLYRTIYIRKNSLRLECIFLSINEYGLAFLI